MAVFQCMGQTLGTERRSVSVDIFLWPPVPLKLQQLMVFISFKAGVFFLRQRLERVSVVVLVSYDDASKKKQKTAQVQHVCVQENTHCDFYSISYCVCFQV